ncbi:Tyrosine/DOPA decarboxylase 2 [Dichanthelium oligosanthes]|uniref:Tyrosine/DOPA decarboxylase 2 n=1 Tax=Dichanthelium oligosanthes TaxID=888268 RepID=A0A1E5VJT8_9POAL|nr:Tyrosine/DOPA decarboxylase 2 [Dichanthelium oligosanthes]
MAPPSAMAILNHANNAPAAIGTDLAAAVAPPAMPPLGHPAPLDADEFRRQGRLVVDFIADYYARIHEYPVRPAVAPGFLARQLPETAPAKPEPNALAAALRDVRDLILPGVTHWQSPNHFAHFAATASNVGALGEALAAGLNINPFTWAASPAATELEVVVTDWLGKALHLPENLLFSGGGGGTLLGTSCEAMLCTIVAARDRKLAEIGEERIGDLVVYCSDQTHFSFQKAARIAGIRRGNFREIPTSRESGFTLSPKALLAAVRADEAAGRVPLFLCTTVGTTPTAAVDPIRELCAVLAGHDVWVHVDAAYAGAACVCPEFRHAIAGAEAVDSFSTNPHKWLLANMDCCALWVRRPEVLTAALGTDHDVILKDPSAQDGRGVVDYKDWQVALSRRFRALKLWLVLRCHGVEGLRGFVRAHVRMAAAFEDMVRADTRFEVPVPRRFSLVCFRLRSVVVGERRRRRDDAAANELNRRLLEAVNATGRTYMSCAVVGGVYMLRCAIGNSLTEEGHVREAWSVVQEEATAILATAAPATCSDERAVGNARCGMADTDAPASVLSGKKLRI